MADQRPRKGLVSIALCVLWALFVAAAVADPPATLTATRTLTVELRGPSPATALDDAGFEILLGGRQTRLVGAGKAPSPWQIVLYFDLNLATRAGVADAARALSRVSRELVRLGAVDVVLANPWPEALAENERDPVALQDALAWVTDEAESAGEIIIAREEFLEAAQAGQSTTELGEQARREELQLLRTGREGLLAWLSLQNHRGPRCLFLVRDGFDLQTETFYATGGERELEASSSPPAPSLDLEGTARDLAADGWTVLPLALAGRPEVLSANPVALRALAEASGGRIVSEPAELSAAVKTLADRWQLVYEISGPATGEPEPLEVHSLRPEWSVRGPSWGSTTTPVAFSQARARWLIEEPDWIEQGLPTEGVLLQGRSSSAPPGMVTLETLLLLPGGRSGNSIGPFRVSLLLASLGGESSVTSETARTGDLSGAEAWKYRRHLKLPPDTAEAVVLIEDLRGGLWGAANVDMGGGPLPVEGLRIVTHAPPEATAPGAVGSDSPREVVLRLLPPRKRPATGRTRFNTLISNPAVRRVDFLLDRELVVSDDRPPFAATLDLGEEPDAHAVTAVAYGHGAEPMGEHTIMVNPERGTFTVFITEMTRRGPGGELQIEAEIDLPPGEVIERVEFFRNEALIERLEEPPWRVELTEEQPGPSEYVRVAAFLESGDSTEDARLLSSTGIEERVEVNLVELNVVVTEREGAPIRGLEPKDFAIFFKGRPRSLERFALAEEIPLVLGLVIDTSESMVTVMTDTKKAGAQFLGETLREGDEAFLVDFDTRPRLAREATGDFVALLRQFNSLRPEGFTALYDAIIFSLLQFEQAVGRKALVLLTDGDDYRSRYGPRRCIQYGRQLGVPVYIISLGALQSPRRGFRRSDLEGITGATGGKVFYITEMTQLSEAYAQINAELRSQYVLTFSTDHPLTDEELSAIEVKVSDPKLSVRTVVGGQNTQ